MCKSERERAARCSRLQKVQPAFRRASACVCVSVAGINHLATEETFAPNKRTKQNKNSLSKLGKRQGAKGKGLTREEEKATGRQVVLLLDSSYVPGLCRVQSVKCKEELLISS